MTLSRVAFSFLPMLGMSIATSQAGSKSRHQNVRDYIRKLHEHGMDSLSESLQKQVTNLGPDVSYRQIFIWRSKKDQEHPECGRASKGIILPKELAPQGPVSILLPIAYRHPKLLSFHVHKSGFGDPSNRHDRDVVQLMEPHPPKKPTPTLPPSVELVPLLMAQD